MVFSDIWKITDLANQMQPVVRATGCINLISRSRGEHIADTFSKLKKPYFIGKFSYRVKAKDQQSAKANR